MLNIEIHGFYPQVALRLADMIWKLFEGEPFADDIVVTIPRTTVKDRKGVERPFIRLVSAPGCQHNFKVLEKLKSLGVDIEHLILADFIAKAYRDRKGG